MGRSDLELRLLGRPRLLAGGRDLTPEIGSKGLAVLAFIALDPDAGPTREKLAGTFWSDKAEDAARYRLRHTLWELRKTLGADYVQSDNSRCWLNTASGICVDALQFQSGCAQLGIGTQRWAPCPEHVPTLSALDLLYRGDLLEGLMVQESPLFEEWFIVQRERLQLLHQELLWSLARAQQSAKDHAGAIYTLTRLIRADPLHERNYRTLMAIHLDQGDRVSALRVYRHCALTLSAELGMCPSPETERVRQMIKEDQAEPVHAQLERATDLCRRKKYAEAWTVCAAAESLAADPVTSSQVALLRAEIALQENRRSDSLSFIQTARQSLARALRG